jgi:hypothetical protein
MRNKLKPIGMLIWDDEDGQGVLHMAEEFGDEHVITRLDAMKDWIELLTKIYDETLQDYETRH